MAGVLEEFRPGRAQSPSTRVEISVSCRNLLGKDPICLLLMKQLSKERFHEVGRTERIRDNPNPDFVNKFYVDYRFEELQKMRLEIYDIFSKDIDLSHKDVFGRIDCTLGEIVAAPGGRIQKRLEGDGKKARGFMTVRVEEVADCKEVATMQFRAENLDKKDFISKPNPFLVFSKVNEDRTFTVVHTTEVMKNTLGPAWRSFIIKVSALCNGDRTRSIKVECFNSDKDGGHNFIGGFTTTLHRLAKGRGKENVYELINSKLKTKKSYKNSGTCHLEHISMETQSTFVDFIQGGTQITVTVAIDFTASNGDPVDPKSLHHCRPDEPSLYARALRAVGDILQVYNKDKLLPALGFGARLPPNGMLSHEFFLNLHPSSPFCQGIDGVLDAYHAALRAVQLYGPTNFAPIIKTVAGFARAQPDGSQYFVLLILTDGVVTDMQDTKAAIVEAASLPVSIIIVGIGDADFSAMVELDGDEVRLSHKGRTAERDIVQFVPFRNFIDPSGNLNVSQQYLAAEVLEELPHQVTSYMAARGIQPQANVLYPNIPPTAPSS